MKKYTIISANANADSGPETYNALSGPSIHIQRRSLSVDFTIDIDPDKWNFGMDLDEFENFLRGAPDWATEEMVEYALKETYPERYL